MRIGTKITLIGVGGILLTALVFVLTAFWQGRAFGSKAQGEIGKLVDADLNHITRSAYDLVKSHDESLRQQVDHALNVACDQFQSMGGVALGGEAVSWKAVNQFTREARLLHLPRMTLGKTWLGTNTGFEVETPLVDKIKRLTGSTVTVFQRMDAAGDILRVATNVQTKDGKRAIGTFIPAINPDGKPNPVVAKVMTGETYYGNAFVVNAWYVSAYEPIKNNRGAVVGVLYVGYKQESLPTLRQTLLDTRVGRTGSIAVVGATGQIQGHYLISKDGRRDDRSAWDERDADGKPLTRQIVRKALGLMPGEIAAFRFRMRTEADGKPIWKIYRIAYYAPWNWVIVTGAEEDEFLAFNKPLQEGQTHMLRLFVLVALLMACGCGAFSWTWAKTIARRLRQMEQAANALAVGKVNQNIAAGVRDEIGQAANAFRAIIAYQTEMAYGGRKNQRGGSDIQCHSQIRATTCWEPPLRK